MEEFNPYSHIVRPLMTERSTRLKEKNNQYVFEIASFSSKADVKRSVEEIFKVTVLNVRTMNVGGKFRRMGRNGGYRADWKKAIVTLKSGEVIDLVEQAA